MHYINYNGRLVSTAQPVLHPDDGGFRYGYGVFETMLVVGGHIRNAALHWQRLFAGLEALHLQLPKLHHAAWMAEQVLRTVHKNKLQQLCRVRLQVSAGGGGLYGTGAAHPHFVVECFALEPETLELNTNGLQVGVATGLAKSPDMLSNLKTCNALLYAVAAGMAKQHKWNDALVANTNGHLIESTIANLFWIKDGTTYTPPLADGCINGIMRQCVLSVTPVTEQSLHADALLHADEVFLTNAVKGVRWVGSIGDTTYTCKLTKHIHHLTSQHDAA